jgi:GNAT superfamily N-acetyltransferase
VDGLHLSIIDAGSASARDVLSHYFAELDERFRDGFDATTAFDEAAAGFNPPHGLFLIALVDHELAGCGAVQFLDGERGEIKRMWVDRRHRGIGLGKRLLARLEHEVAATGRAVVVLDTNEALTEAASMYTRSGYDLIERYNDNPDAHLWFRKHLGPPDTSG